MSIEPISVVEIIIQLVRQNWLLILAILAITYIAYRYYQSHKLELINKSRHYNKVLRDTYYGIPDTVSHAKERLRDEFS